MLLPGERLLWSLDPLSFAGALGMEPDPWQADLLLSKSERLILNCSRQSGKSSVAAVLALWRAICFEGSLILCLSPTLRQSSELFNKVLTYYGDLGRPIPNKEEQKLSVKLENRSRIVALPGSEATVRGFSSADLLIIDEAARVSDRLFHGVRPMLAVSSGKMLLLSTPNGQQGTFYETWVRGGDYWQRFEVPATSVPRISREFLEMERHELPHTVYRQEYLCSFEQPADAYFVAEHVDAMLEPADDVELLDLGGGLRV